MEGETGMPEAETWGAWVQDLEDWPMAVRVQLRAPREGDALAAARAALGALGALPRGVETRLDWAGGRLALPASAFVADGRRYVLDSADLEVVGPAAAGLCVEYSVLAGAAHVNALWQAADKPEPGQPTWGRDDLCRSLFEPLANLLDVSDTLPHAELWNLFEALIAGEDDAAVAAAADAVARNTRHAVPELRAFLTALRRPLVGAPAVEGFLRALRDWYAPIFRDDCNLATPEGREALDLSLAVWAARARRLPAPPEVVERLHHMALDHDAYDSLTTARLTLLLLA